MAPTPVETRLAHFGKKAREKNDLAVAARFARDTAVLEARREGLSIREIARIAQMDVKSVWRVVGRE